MNQKHRKFTFLILDDEEKTQTSSYLRIPQMVLNKYFTNSENPNSYVLPGQKSEIKTTISEENLSFDLIVLCGERFLNANQTFNTVIKNLKKIIDEKNIDAFFIDLKWDMGKSKDEVENLLKTFFIDLNFTTNNTNAPWDNINGELPYTLAGMRFLQKLPIDDRPKIIFSGAEETKWFTWLFSALGNRILSNDTRIGKLGAGVYTNEIHSTLEAYFYKKQATVCRNLSQEKISELVTRLDNNKFDTFDIPDIENDDFVWSLRSLFPKEINNLTDENKKYIISLLEMDFRKTIIKLATWHDAHVNTIFESHAKHLDMKVGTKNGQAIEYESLEKFFKNVNLTDLTTVRAKLYNSFDSENGGFKWADEIKSKYKLTNAHIDFNSKETLVRKYGIYWGQLLYIVNIAHMNYTNYNSDNNSQFSISVQENSNQLSIKIECGETKDNSIKQETDKITFNNNSSINLSDITQKNVHTLNSEQITDILRIVCYLWKSEFIFMYGENKISFTWDFCERKMKYELCEDSSNSNNVSYIINIQQNEVYE